MQYGISVYVYNVLLMNNFQVLTFPSPCHSFTFGVFNLMSSGYKICDRLLRTVMAPLCSRVPELLLPSNCALSTGLSGFYHCVAQHVSLCLESYFAGSIGGFGVRDTMWTVLVDTSQPINETLEGDVQ